MMISINHYHTQMERHYTDLDRTGDDRTRIDKDLYLKVHTKLEDVEDWPNL